ncbi:MAG: phosphoribosylformylglycinamidine synthase subunit PurS [Verrucomicrobiae bacterium]|nr:phosphoribosylformylglycinamidine synthase subunit PurS [Verrucomicrobiae bacterium]
MKARITVMPKRTVLDPQGKAVKHALESLGFREVRDVRIGKFLEVDLDTGDVEAARRLVDNACQQLLSNPVIEEYRFEITP